jgi:hypothetical protein
VKFRFDTTNGLAGISEKRPKMQDDDGIQKLEAMPSMILST